MYTIGEFSNLAHVSARSLRYYDAMGLLRPAHMGENGYRYYTGGQLPALAKIETLKSYGFTLAEVKELLLLPETELAHRIHVRAPYQRHAGIQYRPSPAHEVGQGAGAIFPLYLVEHIRSQQHRAP